LLKTPKHILQEDELSVLLKALDFYAKNKYATSGKNSDIAVGIAKELRNKAGWLRNSAPKTIADDIVEEVNIQQPKRCKVCED
tara:strand:- start:5248 stop:5496 length:249 start_codon:yes stop_codon:yes gene_type:complete